MSEPILNDKLCETLLILKGETISSDRKNILNRIVSYGISSLKKDKNFKLVFVCTHNSRRSQLAQVWAFAMSKIYRIPFESYSGGVEVTAFHHNAISALSNQGFIIETEESKNPKSDVKLNPDRDSVICFSKLYDDAANPKTNFATIMVCDHADANCPFVAGADERIPLKYEDPKRFDNDLNPVLGYEATSLEIGNEMNYVFSRLTQR